MDIAFLGAFTFVVLLLFVERRIEAGRTERILAALTVERRELADRIQHPEIRQVIPSEPVIHDQPKDTAEMAHVGQIVPEFVTVGSKED